MNPMLSAAILLIFILPTLRCVSAGPAVLSLRKIPNAEAVLLRVFFLKPTREVLIEHCLPAAGEAALRRRAVNPAVNNKRSAKTEPNIERSLS